MAKNQKYNSPITQDLKTLNDVVPPSDISAEKYVLGCLISESESFDRVSEILSEECFYNDTNRDIFLEILSLRGAGQPVDLISVTDKVRNVQSIENVGGIYYVACLKNEMSSSLHLEYHSSVLLELSAKRKLLKKISEVPILIDSRTDISDVLDMLQTTTEEILKSFNPVGSNIDSILLHYSDDVHEPDPILKQGKTLLMSRGNLSFIKGKAKSRKSFLSCIFISSFFGNESFSIQTGVSNGKALLIDTEQADAHVHKVIKRIYRMCGWRVENSNLKVLPLRKYDFKERQTILEKAIKEYNPDFVIIDGAVDIVGDFNNAEESKTVIGLLMKLSTKYNCHICGVLHEGKGNGELRGHYGAEALNKAETVFDVIKEGDWSTVSPNATRNIPFEEFAFKIEEGLPQYVGEVKKQTKAEINDSEIRNIFLQILSPNKSMEYGKLTAEYVEFSGKAKRTAQLHISNALLKGILSKQNGLIQLSNCISDELPF